MENNSQTYDDCYFQYKDIRVEIDEDPNVIRVIKGDKVVKFWYDEDTIQTAELPYSSDIINEFTDVFFE